MFMSFDMKLIRGKQKHLGIARLCLAIPRFLVKPDIKISYQIHSHGILSLLILQHSPALKPLILLLKIE